MILYWATSIATLDHTQSTGHGSDMLRQWYHETFAQQTNEYIVIENQFFNVPMNL